MSPPGPRRGRTAPAVRGPLVAGAVGAVVLGASALVAGMLFAGVGTAGDRGDSRPSPSGTPEPTRTPGPADPPAATEAAPGVALPALPGWRRGRGGTAATAGSRPCPGGGCHWGSARLVSAGTGSGSSRTPRSVAEEDIRPHAESTGRVTGHRVTESGPVTVAGERGYRVRWRTEHATGPDSWTESVAFHSPAAGGRILLLRAGVGIHRDAPPPGDLDRLRSGTHGAGAKA